MTFRTTHWAVLLIAGAIACGNDPAEPETTASTGNEYTYTEVAQDPDDQGGVESDEADFGSDRDEDTRAAADDAVEDAQDAQEDVSEHHRDLLARVEAACEDIAIEQRQICPFTADQITAVNEIDDGVELRLRNRAREEDHIEDLVDCYRASKAAGMAFPAPATVATADTTGGGTAETDDANAPDVDAQPVACLLDDPELDVDVDDEAGRVSVEITSGIEGRVAELRRQASDFHGEPNRATAER